ncbi:MAG TPA: 4-alpha-glucanotransferase [Pyrinomonadaceae bacterium]|nr:4-alpha-glucanotransferase [Pyrinomonadaceae bacterium]
MKFPRASGILLHPTSLPGEFGIGDLGPQAFKFVDFLAEAKQAYWQILPLGPTGWGDSPYASFSAFAGNTLLISPEKLIEAGLLDSDFPQLRTTASSDRVEHAKRAGESEKVDYGAVYESKNLMLRSAFEEWRETDRNGFESFTSEHGGWLEDYALYRAIKASQNQKPWFEWDDALKLRDENALDGARRNLSEEILAEKFYQFLFFKQWSEVKEYANTKGVKIVGDVPIFVALDSADVWRHREQFKLNPDGSPKVVSGVPPDYFSKTGQLWGNPIYDWEAMRAGGFWWWIERVRSTLKAVDILRIDHFRGFAGAWEIPGGNPTAEHGEWVDAPGKELFTTLQNTFGELPFWVEDLGFVTPDVEALRDEFEFPGMRILQFAFGGDARNEALPHNYTRNCIVYTGTHDNDTVLGWWDSQAADSDARKFCEKYLGRCDGEMNWEMIRAAWASVADTAVAPLQDILGRGNEARMNFPSSTSGNWQWRFRERDLTEEVAAKLKELTEIYARDKRV